MNAKEKNNVAPLKVAIPQNETIELQKQTIKLLEDNSEMLKKIILISQNDVTKLQQQVIKILSSAHGSQI
ncbi:MAG: hypothetical protein LBK47_07915 [Prevotellaceae bacterium]|jgi:hypothetical protein|nr:hypothetical protein [Prevotellaceae bacterium]